MTFFQFNELEILGYVHLQHIIDMLFIALFNSVGLG